MRARLRPSSSVIGGLRRSRELKRLTEVFEKSGAVLTREMDIWQKDEAQRRVRISAPARLKGTGLFSTGEGDLHLSMPVYAWVRRVVGDHRGDAFMGTDFTLEDLARVTFSNDRETTVESAEGGLQVLYLRPQDAKTQGKETLRLWVKAGSFWVVRIDHLGEGDKVLRRVTLEDFKAVSGQPMAHRITVEDLKKARRSVAVVSGV